MAYIRGAKASGITVQGLEQLQRQLKSLGVGFPKRNIRRASNKGMKPVLKQVKANARKHRQSGEMEKGLIKIEEKGIPRRKKKVVYYVGFDASKTSIFRKPIPDTTRGSRGGQTRIPWAYYPISVEYGFHVDFGKRTKPAYFIKTAIEQTQQGSLQLVTDDLLKSIQQIAKKNNRP